MENFYEKRVKNIVSTANAKINVTMMTYDGYIFFRKWSGNDRKADVLQGIRAHA